MTLQVINTLNVDYESDRKVFQHLTRGRILAEQFTDPRMVEALYAAAFQQVGEDPFLLQQVAVYEMRRPGGNLAKAADHLARARALLPNNEMIMHSLAELQLRRAETVESDLQASTYLREAENLARPLARPSAVGSHAFHTLAKAQLVRLSRAMSGPSDAWNDVEIGELVKATEQAIQNGLQRFPGDSYLLFTESRLARLLADDDRAEAAVQAAFDRNATNAFVASRLAKLQVDRGRIPDAIRTFEISLSAGVNDRQIHFGYAKLLLNNQLGTADDITYHLRRGFTEGDSNVEAQYWYARQLYVNGDIADAQARFRELRDLPLDPAVKRAIRGEIVDGDDARRFSGTIDRLEFNFAFVVRDGENDALYLHRIGCPPAVWDSLRRGSRIWFSIGFNFWGATAFDAVLQ